ncbi:uncharacterized protein LOC120492430 [Pimephales promelas]|uniref:uncharacterized protein LOC120492430 n=1 Tax=Pimephales promelas TaxID=90988 RepID=UPI0019555D52|nr:uncharacterized protein LOC120492430 [Pimephales promelas]
MTGIIPKSKAKGTDICFNRGFNCIIRSDLGCYMKIGELNKNLDISIHSLHPACKNGDHYLSANNGPLYIIKGKSVRSVNDLTTDYDAKVFTLHPNCQGGDHYFFMYYEFIIIFKEKGTYRKTSDLNTDSYPEEFKLHPDCSNGLYYWGVGSSFCFIKPASEWGVEFGWGNNVRYFTSMGVESVHPDALNFLPGGLSITKGASFGKWENIKTIKNDSNTPVTWRNKINKKVGYNKEKMTQITHNWNIATSYSVESGDLIELIAKIQFSYSAEYGGSHVITKTEIWKEVTEVEETLSFELKPNEGCLSVAVPTGSRARTSAVLP